MTIRTKLLAGFAVLLIFISCISVIAIHRLSDLKDRLDFIVNVSAKKIRLMENHITHDCIFEIARMESNILLSHYSSEMHRDAGIADSHKNEYYAHMKELRLLVDKADREQVDELNAWFEKYFENVRRVVDLALSGKVEEARQLSLEKNRPLLDKVHQLATNLADAYGREFALKKAQSEEEYGTARLILISSIIIVVLSGSIIAVSITRGIVKRAQRISDKARHIASGGFFEKGEIEIEDELFPVSQSLREISMSFENITDQAQRVTHGDLEASIELRSRDDQLGLTLQKMTDSLREAKDRTERQDWLKSGQNALNQIMRGDQEPADLGRNVVTFLAKYTGAQIAALYVSGEGNGGLSLLGSYAGYGDIEPRKSIKMGEGLAGQAALERETVCVKDIPEDYVRINSATGESLPRHILVSPLLLGNNIKGVVELGSFSEFLEMHREFLSLTMESIAIAVNSAQVRIRMRTLLEDTQLQAERLRAQEEELRQINEELHEQTVELKASEEKLKEQQSELEVINQELEEKTDKLESQKAEVTNKNTELENARREIEQKAQELEIKSRYKSEFLANMSHELRTPLNSLLILAQDLAENRYGNLNGDQVESARIVYSSGTELLELINDILDLAKVEAGKLPIAVTEVPLQGVMQDLDAAFRPMVETKHLDLKFSLDTGLPSEIRTDRKRLMQIMKNLISNAVKFTEKGGISVRLQQPGSDADLSRSGLDPRHSIAVSVVDTGIGIPKDKQLEIFEAFQQIKGDISRKYGGTGLGLSIAREMTRLLGGEIQVQSEPEKGSTFVLYLPFDMDSKRTEERRPVLQDDAPIAYRPSDPGKPEIKVNAIPDDRNQLAENEKAILIIEDDPNFSAILMKQCHYHGFKCLASATGEDGLNLAGEYLPEAIILDIHLPGVSGWHVLDALKQNIKTRHIPVHIISVDDVTMDAFKKGAIGFAKKPVTQGDLDQAFRNVENTLEKKIKDLLLIEDNVVQAKVVAQLIGNTDVIVTTVGTAQDAIEVLKSKRFDCMVLDLGLPDMTGFQLLNSLDEDKDAVIPPTIVYTGKELTKEEETALSKYAETIIIKGVKSEERLLDETALFLHRVISNLPEKKQKIITELYSREDIFSGKKVLLVDDDMRNVFALSKVLREKGMDVLRAEHGQAALEMLEEHQTVDLVLMDIMMPVMDGHEAIRRMRNDPRFKNIPVIAQTAKAMKEDREKAIAAGANDYIEKPLSIERLLSMMRVWLYQ